jgi:hypothetical protein
MWEDIAFAVLFRLLKDKRQIAHFKPALRKLRDILAGLPLDN